MLTETSSPCPRLRSRALPQQDVNKRRLGVLFDELQRGEKGEDRWKEALDGRTKGTTTGSSQGIKM